MYLPEGFDYIKLMGLGRPDGGPPDADALAAAVRGLAATYDDSHGGFGDAPKFPPSMVPSTACQASWVMVR